MNRKLTKSIFCLIPLLCAAAAFGQESRGAISGRVADPTGAVVPGATVQAVNVDTNVVLQTTSNESGNYQIPFVVPGNYKVVVEHAGFKKLERPNVRVSTASE